MSSFLLGSTTKVVVCSHELHIHDSVLQTIPFFQAQKERWSGQNSDHLRVELPAGTNVDDLVLVLAQAYFPEKPLPPLGIHKALRAAQIASMLSCSPSLMQVFTQAVHAAVKSDEDISYLSDWTANFDLPDELACVTKRMRSDDPSFETLQRLYKSAVKDGCDVWFEVMVKHLRQHSQKGGAALKEVATLLSTSSDGKPRSLRVAFAFLTKHSQFYTDFIPLFLHRLCSQNHGLFIRGGGVCRCLAHQDKDPELIDYCKQFIDLGANLFTARRLCLEDFLNMVEQIFKDDIYFNGSPLFADPQIRNSVSSFFVKLDVSIQTPIIDFIVQLPPDCFTAFVDKDLISAMVLESQLALVAHISNLAEGYVFSFFIDPDKVKALSKPAATVLLSRCTDMTRESRLELLLQTQPEEVESFDGYW